MEAIHGFVETSGGRPLGDYKILPKPKADPPPRSHTPEEFFKLLHFYVKNRRDIQNPERFVLLLALRYLEIESTRGPILRDKEFNRTVWTRIHPSLKKYRLVDGFQHDQKLKEKLKGLFE